MAATLPSPSILHDLYAELSRAPSVVGGPNPSDIVITVVTLNAWGIPGISKDRRKRFKAIAELLVKNAEQWDIICLQEVWSENDFRMLVQATREHYPSSYHFYSGVMGSGVCVFTRGRIVATLMQRFSLNGYAYKIQHGDWFGGKVCGLAKIVHKGLLINMYATHTHATYSEGKNDEYKSHRIVQSFELSQFIRFTSTPTTLSLAKGIEHSTLPQLAAVVANGAATSGANGACNTLPAVSANQYKLVQQQLHLQQQLDELHRQLSSSLSVHHNSIPHTERDGNVTDASIADTGNGAADGGNNNETIDWLHPVTIVAGDFNMESYDLGCQLVRRLAGVQDTWENYIRHAKLDPEDEANIDASTSETYDNYYTPKSVKRKRGLHCGKRIDYIFFCQPSGLASPYHIHCTKAAASINRLPNSTKGRCYSDHKGYVATLSVRRKPVNVALAASRKHIQQRLLARQFRSPSTKASTFDPLTPTIRSRGTSPTKFNKFYRFFPDHTDAFRRSKSTVEYRSRSSTLGDDVKTPTKTADGDVHDQHHLKTIEKFSVPDHQHDDHHNFYSNAKLNANNNTETGPSSSHPHVRATQRSIIHDLTGRNEELLEQAIDIVESGFRRVHRNARKFVAVGILAFILFFATFALDSVFRLHIALVITVAVSRVVCIIAMFVCAWLSIVMTRIERNALLAARNTMLLMKGECNPDTLDIDMSSSSSESDLENNGGTTTENENKENKPGPEKPGDGGATENGNVVRTVDETVAKESTDELPRQFVSQLKRSMRRSERMSKRRGGIVAERSPRGSVVLNPNDLLVQIRRNDNKVSPVTTSAQNDDDTTPSPTDDVHQQNQSNLPANTDSLSTKRKRPKKLKVKIVDERSPVSHINPSLDAALDEDERRKISAVLTQKQNQELAELHYHTEGDQLEDDEVTIRGSVRRKPARKHTTSAEPADTSSSSDVVDVVNEHLRRGSGRRRSKPKHSEAQSAGDDPAAEHRPGHSRKPVELQTATETSASRPPLTASISSGSEAMEADDEFTPSSTPTDKQQRRAVESEMAELNENFVEPLSGKVLRNTQAVANGQN